MWLDRKLLKELDEEAGINEPMIDFVDRATQDKTLHEEDFREWDNPNITEEQARDFTQLGEMAKNFTKPDFAIIIGVCLTKYPLLVFQVIAEFVMDLIKQRRVSND